MASDLKRELEELHPLMVVINRLFADAKITRFDELCIHLMIIQIQANDGPPGAKSIICNYVRKLLKRLEAN
jgi:hypothetical protein